MATKGCLEGYQKKLLLHQKHPKTGAADHKLVLNIMLIKKRHKGDTLAR